MKEGEQIINMDRNLGYATFIRKKREESQKQAKKCKCNRPFGFWGLSCFRGYSRCTCERCGVNYCSNCLWFVRDGRCGTSYQICRDCWDKYGEIWDIQNEYHA